MTFTNIVRAIAAFERRLISGTSRVDRFRSGEEGALTESERIRGYQLMFTEELECHHCHGGFNFTIAVDYAGLPEPGVHFFNNGLYNLGGAGRLSDRQPGPVGVHLRRRQSRSLPPAHLAQRRRHRTVHARRQRGDA